MPIVNDPVGVRCQYIAPKASMTRTKSNKWGRKFDKTCEDR